jgi:hypothetical protein
MPADEAWQRLIPDPGIALVYLSSRDTPTYRVVDPDLVYPLLLRFNGFFTLAECLENLTPGWRGHDLSPLRQMLSGLAQVGVVDSGLSSPTASNLDPVSVAV